MKIQINEKRSPIGERFFLWVGFKAARAATQRVADVNGLMGRGLRGDFNPSRKA